MTDMPHTNDRDSRATVFTGTRDDVAAELHDSAIGWLHMGRDDISREAHHAHMKITSGDDTATVGHITYSVE
jgi:hypothetical protein